MNAREVIFSIRPDQEAEFSAAFQKWSAIEPLICGVSIFGTQAKAFLLPVRNLDVPHAGGWHNDRPRALALIREHIPENVVVAVTIEGKDWLR